MSEIKGIEATEKMMGSIARLYTKKPIPILAMQINQTFWVKTLEGNFQAKEGDYLIRGIKGELYACDREIFEQSYELLNLPEEPTKEDEKYNAEMEERKYKGIF